MTSMALNLPSRLLTAAVLALAGTLAVSPAGAESETRVIMELSASAYRGRNNWYFTGNGMADIRFASIGNDNMRAEAAVEFYPVDLSGGSSLAAVPSLNLKRLWMKAGFPNWRLTAGKTKVAWGNGMVFNSGDILFGSLSPYLDFTDSTLRDDTAFLTAFNIPTGDFSYIEGVLLPPSLLLDGGAAEIQTIDKSSGGMRYFFRAGGWRFEGGYLYKGDAKVSSDLLGHRPYMAVHGHAGVDLYGAVSLAAGPDADAGVNRDTWEEVRKTMNFSIGAFHQLQAGYDGTITLRLEALVMPWQNWSARNYQEVLDGSAGYYGIMIYPEITWVLRSTWTVGLQSVISPVDASAQITGSFGWDVFQGFTLLGYVTVNAGDGDALFASDRREDWPDYPGTTDPWVDYEPNGVSVTLGTRYSY